MNEVELSEAAKRMPPVPRRMQTLPRDHRGFVVPWFVAFIDGKPDFRVIREGGIPTAHNKKLCWLCGQPRGQFGAFVIGPMCAINRVSSEPPSHLECAQFAAMACPFLTRPRMRRNERDIPEESKWAAGNGIKRNPGCALVWVTKSYKPMKVHNGVLFQVGDPEEVYWYAEGREATRDEVTASIDSGLPILQADAQREGPAAVAALSRYIERAMPLLPAQPS